MGTMLLATLLLAAGSTGPTPADELWKRFQNPPAEARPFVRWWWNGNRVTEVEILRELDLLEAAGIATTTFVAYLSVLTNKAYTATQYALFSSIMLLLAKFIAGFSGWVVDASSYPLFFVYAALLGLPSIGLIKLLMNHEQLKGPEPALTGQG